MPVKTAREKALAGEIEAVVTCPIHKDALNLAGHHYPGHTELLAHLCGVRDAVMMLTADALRIVHVSTHVSLRDACDLVTKERILRVMQLGVDATRAMGVEKPRVVVPGLNPHSGEGGLFGTEEEAQVSEAKIARVYADALFRAAEAEGRVQPVRRDLHAFVEAVRGSDELRSVLRDQDVAGETRKRLVLELTEGGDPLVDRQDARRAVAADRRRQ